MLLVSLVPSAAQSLQDLVGWFKGTLSTPPLPSGRLSVLTISRYTCLFPPTREWLLRKNLDKLNKLLVGLTGTRKQLIHIRMYVHGSAYCNE